VTNIYNIRKLSVNAIGKYNMRAFKLNSQNESSSHQQPIELFCQSACRTVRIQKPFDPPPLPHWGTEAW